MIPCMLFSQIVNKNVVQNVVLRRQDNNNTHRAETGVVRRKSIIWLQGTVGYLNTRVIQLLLHQNEEHTSRSDR